MSPAVRRVDTARHGRGGGVYAYRTAKGTRWRFVFRRSDGTQTSKRGFASERAARDAKRRLIEQVERGELRHTKETFGGYWERWLARRRPYLEPGTWSGYEITGRKRLMPAFGSRSLGELSVDEVRDFIADLAEAVEGGELAAKPVNNALGTLVVCLNDAVKDGLMASNPALRVHRLPAGHIERDYLRLDEIPRYLDACSEIYRPLAEVLIGSGLRISKACALGALGRLVLWMGDLHEGGAGARELDDVAAPGWVNRRGLEGAREGAGAGRCAEALAAEGDARGGRQRRRAQA